MPAQSELLHYKKGAVIFRENDPAAEAYIIISGRVEIFKEEGPTRKVLAHLGIGQVFGEMALILEKPRSASVMALDDTVLRRVPAEVFHRLINGSPKRLAPLMRTLFERLRTMNSKLAYAEGPVEAAAPAPAAKTTAKAHIAPASVSKSVSLVGLTAEAEAALESSGGTLEIAAFPFKIGRKTGSLFAGLMNHNDLYIADEDPFQVSRNHCAVNKLSGEHRFFVQDRGSSLGTIVNGQRLGGKFEKSELELNDGRNELVLGAEKSPYRFQVVISPAL